MISKRNRIRLRLEKKFSLSTKTNINIRQTKNQMFQFNPDGSLKVPGNIVRNSVINHSKMQNERCIKVRKEVIFDRSPKKCAIFITLSKKVNYARFIETLYAEFSKKTESTTSLTKISEDEYKVEVGTSYRRCTDCCSFVNELKEFIQVVEEKGSCTFERSIPKFSYEDHFD